ncbi:MAG TPA: hypothetical protein VFF11_08025 [Candidatus Binatia bacterium]|nr:hypothetical protein [Candidatus Binatia bacterium]
MKFPLSLQRNPKSGAHHTRAARAAFTPVEVVIDSLIFSIAALAAYLCLAEGMQILQSNRESLRATQRSANSWSLSPGCVSGRYVVAHRGGLSLLWHF